MEHVYNSSTFRKPNPGQQAFAPKAAKPADLSWVPALNSREPECIPSPSS